jgi:hypothetical protein
MIVVMEFKSNAQECLYKLKDEILGKDWYIVDPVGGNQANEIITQKIIEMYKDKTASIFEKFKRQMIRGGWLNDR